jgi:hypothetical protein
MTFLTDYLRELSQPPAPLTRREKFVFWALFLITAGTRFLARSRSPLDWDEAIFCSGMREYDVVPHHPHPPGYPLFILAAKTLQLIFRDDFRSLRAVATIAAILLFAAVFFLCRELRFRFASSLAAAILTSFLPTVWYYGGTALSDIPALCAVIAASGWLLAGGRTPAAFVAGMFLLGIAGGIRPQHVLIGIPALIVGAIVSRNVRVVAKGLLVFALVVAASYTGAAFFSSNAPRGYFEQVRGTAEHIGQTDSYRNPARIPLRDLAEPFFITPFRGGRAGRFVLLLAIAGIVDGLLRRRVAVWLLLMMFVPTAIVSWTMLDTSALTRYALAYGMLYTVCAAAALDGLSHVVSATARPAIVVIASMAIAVALAIWTWPALTLVASQTSPPAAAMAWIRSNVPHAGTRVFVAGGLSYHSEYALAGYNVSFFSDYEEIPDDAYAPGNYCIVDRVPLQPNARVWRYPHKRLVEIARESYFDVSVMPMNAMVRFESGWFGDEYTADNRWQWMAQKSVTRLPALPITGELSIKAFVPVKSMPHAPTVTITWNGAIIERGLSGESLDRKWILPSQPGQANELRIEVDTVAPPSARDWRAFGLQLFEISWSRTDGLPYGM